MLEPFLEPVEPNENERGVDEDGRGKHGDEVQGDLLVSTEQIKINGIQAALSGSACPKEEGIDICNVASRENDNRTDNAPSNNIDVMDEDEIDADVPHKRNPRLDRGHFPGEFPTSPRGLREHLGEHSEQAGYVKSMEKFRKRNRDDQRHAK